MFRRLPLIAGCLLALGLSFVTGGVIGWGRSNLQMYHNRFEEERSFVAPIIADNPAFANVQICERSNGGIYLLGEVDSQEDLELLRNQMLKALGELRVAQVMLAVGVKR